MGYANSIQQNGAMTENESQKWMTSTLALNQRVNAALYLKRSIKSLMNNVVRFKILCYLSNMIRNLQCKCVLP